MRGITQRILTAEIVQPRGAHDASASALRRPSRLEAAAANRTRPALDRSANNLRAVAVDRTPGPTCRSERRCLATCTYQRPLGGDWRRTETKASRESSNAGRFISFHSLRSNHKLTDLRAVVVMVTVSRE
jgi:hypothetical protein